MVEDENKKEEQKFDFDSAGEVVGYISLEQAVVLAMRTADDEPGNYGRRSTGVRMVFDVVQQEEGEDYYTITLSFRPEGAFVGTAGEEQFFIAKEGTVERRQVRSLPREKRFPLVPLAIGLAVVAVVAGVVVASASGVFGGGGNGEAPAAATAPLALDLATATPTTKPTLSAPIVTSAIPAPESPSPVAAAPTTAPAPTRSLIITDLSGRWDSPSGAFLVFRRASPLFPAYHFQEYDPGGSSHGDGRAVLAVSESMLHIINGTNDIIGNYGAEFNVSGNYMNCVIVDAIGTKLTNVEFTAKLPDTGTPVFVDVPPEDSPLTLDISGQWNNPYGGGFVEFTRVSPIAVAYDFQEYDVGGSSYGEGGVSLEGEALHIEGLNNFVGDYSGTLQVAGDLITGILQSELSGRIPFSLIREPTAPALFTPTAIPADTPTPAPVPSVPTTAPPTSAGTSTPPGFRHIVYLFVLQDTRFELITKESIWGYGEGAVIISDERDIVMTVRVGDTIHFRTLHNAGGREHAFTIEELGFDIRVPPGESIESYELLLDRAGTFTITDSVNPTQQGTAIIVVE